MSETGEVINKYNVGYSDSLKAKNQSLRSHFITVALVQFIYEFIKVFKIYLLTRTLITYSFSFYLIEQIITGEFSDQLASYFSSSLFHACFVVTSIFMLFLFSWTASSSCLFIADLMSVLIYQFFPAPLRSLIFILAKDGSIRKYIETFTLFCLAQEKCLLDEDYKILWNNRICLKPTLYEMIEEKLAIEYRFIGIFGKYKYFFFWLLLEAALDIWIDREEI